MTDFTEVLAIAAQDQTESGGLEGLIPMFLLIAVAMYFIVLRPERKQRKEREERVNSMKKGDKVISAGGIHGKVIEVDTTHRTVRVEGASKTVMKFNMGSISTVDAKDGGKIEKDSEKKLEEETKKS